MYSLNRGTAVLLGSLTFLLFGGQAFADKVFDKKLPATPGGTLTVDTQVGSIAVTGADVREVTVHATVGGSEDFQKEFEVTAESDSRGVTVHGGRPGGRSWWFTGSTHVKFEIQVPHEYALELKTSGGDIAARTLKGNINAHTSGGDIKLASITGTLDLRTSGGDIQASQLEGDAQLHTSGGTITASDSKGDLDLNTSGGDVRLQNTNGKVTARTSGGDIDANLRGANSGVSLKTSGGNIKIAIPSDFKAALDAHTSGGRVSCDLPVLVRQSDGKNNSLRGDINGGGPVLLAQTSGGSIHIRAHE
jgi:hypothetical protein